MKNPTILQAMFSIMILFSIANATAQNFQYTKKKYSISKGGSRVTKEVSLPQSAARVFLNQYTDAEIIELANYIKKLEAQNTLTGELISIDKIAQTGNTMAAKNTPDNNYTDDELIKMVNYIRFLETTDWTHSVAVIK